MLDICYCTCACVRCDSDDGNTEVICIRNSIVIHLDSVGLGITIYRTITCNDALCSGAGTNMTVSGTHPARRSGNVCCCCIAPLFWLYKYKRSFWWALSWWSVQFGQFLLCCSSTHGAPCRAICKSGGTCSPVRYGVGATGTMHIASVVLQAHLWYVLC